MSDTSINPNTPTIPNSPMIYYLYIFFITIFIWIWFIAGILGFLMSLACFGFNGSISDKFLGILLVLVIGPFYWLYFIYNSNYCTR
jgi:hypothetical protein